MALGLRVVSDDGGPERFRQALFRALASVVEIWTFFGGPAVICSLLSSKGKRIGDVFAGTVVISERGPKLPPPPVMPPSLAWWASSLQLSGLGPEQAELARQFLSRASQLDPQIRDQMAYRIAGDVVARISPPPPPGVPPQYVLAAVLAERHRRELERLRPAPAEPRHRRMGCASRAVGVPRPSSGPSAASTTTARPTRRRLRTAGLARSAVTNSDQHQHRRDDGGEGAGVVPQRSTSRSTPAIRGRRRRATVPRGRRCRGDC